MSSDQMSIGNECKSGWPTWNGPRRPAQTAALVRRHRCSAEEILRRRYYRSWPPLRQRPVLRRQRSCNECAGADTDSQNILPREAARKRSAPAAATPSCAQANGSMGQFSGAQLAPNDAVTEAIVDLLVKRSSCAAIDAGLRHVPRSSVFEKWSCRKQQDWSFTMTTFPGGQSKMIESDLAASTLAAAVVSIAPGPKIWERPRRKWARLPAETAPPANGARHGQHDFDFVIGPGSHTCDVVRATHRINTSWIRSDARYRFERSGTAR